MVSVSWNSLKQWWMNNHFMFNITRRMRIQVFVVTLSIPWAIILIKPVLIVMVLFMPKIRRGWSAIYLINGFMKNVFSFRFFFWSTVPKQFLLDLDDYRLFIQFFMKFSVASWRTDKFLIWTANWNNFIMMMILEVNLLSWKLTNLKD